MGKSILLLLILYLAKYHIRKNDKGERVYRIIKSVVPSGVTKQWVDEKYSGLLKGRVSIAAVDEAQRLRDRETLLWKGFPKLEAEFIFVLGATPMANIGVVCISKTSFPSRG
jgi:SNF2 family DNA or RNA helicase